MKHAGLAMLFSAILAGLAPAAVAPVPAAAAATDKRVSFRIRTLLGRAGSRSIVSDATVEGAPGTDISLTGRAGNFSMVAKLETDLSGDRVRIAADITTRRDAGTSARGLAMFEEDVQRRTIELASDGTESLVVLPFGRNPGGEEITIDVLPEVSVVPANSDAPLNIRIDDVGPGGWLRVQAIRVPHRFDVEAELVRDGLVVARGRGRCFLDEPGRISLLGDNAAETAVLRLAVAGYTNTCPADQIEIAFDVDADGAPILRGWSGFGSSGAPFIYDLGNLSEKLKGAPAQLRVRVTPAEEEQH